jgi:hypothetical protein
MEFEGSRGGGGWSPLRPLAASVAAPAEGNPSKCAL